MNDALRNRLLNFYHNGADRHDARYCGIANNIISYLSYLEKEEFYYAMIDTIFKVFYKRDEYDATWHKINNIPYD